MLRTIESPGVATAHCRPRNAGHPEWGDASRMRPSPAPSRGRPQHRALAARLAVMPAGLEDLASGRSRSRIILVAPRQERTPHPDGGIRIGDHSRPARADGVKNSTIRRDCADPPGEVAPMTTPFDDRTLASLGNRARTFRRLAPKGPANVDLGPTLRHRDENHARHTGNTS